MIKTLLLNMPFVSLARPAMGISLLKARLAEEGFPCAIEYGSLAFAERIGYERYEFILEQISPAMFFGEWLFSQWLFPARDHSGYLATLQDQLKDNPGAFEMMISLQEEVEPFLEDCLTRFGVEAYHVIGFTSTFEQNMPSLALASLIKRRYPEKTIVLGGANCEGVMGLQMHRSFPWVDYVCSGESDFSFPAMIRKLDAGLPVVDTPGLVFRQDGISVCGPPSDRVHAMDLLPDPDFDDYFRSLRVSPLAGRVQPSLLIESARGCWWGAKSHCTFCGLNGSTLAFRAKSAGRVLAELKRQKARYGVSHFLAVDNIMSYEYFRDLLPMLKQEKPGVSLFYEIKSNLKRTQVELLRDAGVYALQPGIESLNTHVLQLMRKGVTALQNVQLLRFCKEYGIEIAWNLLYGFPGETAGDYVETAAVMETIFHLKPPGMVAPIRLDRFSPNYTQAEFFGIVDIKPFAMYEAVYPFPEEVVANLAYFFEYRYADERDVSGYVGAVVETAQRWKENVAGDLTKRYGEEAELVIEDTRTGGAPVHYRLNGLQREIYDLCDEIQSESKLTQLGETRGTSAEDIQGLLQGMLDYRLMMREGNQYLSLAVDPRRRVCTYQPASSALAGEWQ